MSETDDSVLEAVSALEAAGITAHLIGDELERWCIGDLTFSDADLVRLAAGRGLVEHSEPRQPSVMPPPETIATGRPARAETPGLSSRRIP